MDLVKLMKTRIWIEQQIQKEGLDQEVQAHSISQRSKQIRTPIPVEKLSKAELIKILSKRIDVTGKESRSMLISVAKMIGIHQVR